MTRSPALPSLAEAETPPAGTTPGPGGEVDPVQHEQLRRLRRLRGVATGLLGLAGMIFVASLWVPNPGNALLLLRSVAEAALVGGLADWFAVTAMFRRPLGLPIPHTAIVPANKERIGEGLARFLDRHFLTPDLLVPQLRSLRLAERAARWLGNRRNAAAVAAEITKALPYLLRAVDDRDIQAFLGRALGARLDGAALAPLFAELLRLLMAAGSHEGVLDSALDHARAFLRDNEARLLAAVAERRRRWIPRAINREIARAMLRAAAELIEDVRKPDGAARRALLETIDEFVAGLANSPRPQPAEGGARPAILRQPEVQAWVGAVWGRFRDLAIGDMTAPTSRVRRALAVTIAAIGDALAADAAMRERLDATLEALLLEALPWRVELIRFVAEVVRQWQPRTFSDRIEAAVGADLQFIRMNGTIVGGLVGGGLYVISLVAK